MAPASCWQVPVASQPPIDPCRQDAGATRSPPDSLRVGTAVHPAASALRTPHSALPIRCRPSWRQHPAGRCRTPHTLRSTPAGKMPAPRDRPPTAFEQAPPSTPRPPHSALRTPHSPSGAGPCGASILLAGTGRPSHSGRPLPARFRRHEIAPRQRSSRHHRLTRGFRNPQSEIRNPHPLPALVAPASCWQVPVASQPPIDPCRQDAGATRSPPTASKEAPPFGPRLPKSAIRNPQSDIDPLLYRISSEGGTSVTPRARRRGSSAASTWTVTGAMWPMATV